MGDEGQLIGDAAGEAHLVGDQDEIAAFGSKFGDHVEDFGGHFRIEGGGGFIEEEELGADGHGAGDGDALLLAAGEFGGALVGMGFQLEPAEQVEGLIPGLARGELVDDFEGEGEVAEGGEVGEEIVVLKNEPGSEAVLAKGFVMGERECLAAHVNLSGGGEDEAAEDAEQRGFSAAGRADEDEGADIVEGQVH
jgi:hypothetical protein